MFLRALTPTTKSQRLVTVKQIHSAHVHVINDVPDQSLTGDGMITRVPGLLLCVLVADCVPVLVVDPVNRAVGAFHAGWRGTMAGIVAAGLAAAQGRLGIGAEGWQVALGPAIGG